MSVVRFANPRVIYHLLFTISREEINSGNTARALAWLNRLTSDRDTAWANRNILTLQITGYDADRRELYEVPKVCEFLRKLHKKWPYWFFFASHTDYTLIVLQSCIVGAYKGPQEGLVQIDPIDSLDYFHRCTLAMNHIFDRYGFPEDENKRIFAGVMEFTKPYV